MTHLPHQYIPATPLCSHHMGDGDSIGDGADCPACLETLLIVRRAKADEVSDGVKRWGVLGRFLRRGSGR